MSDPKRLLNGEATELERRLLQALAAERPSPALGARMAVGLGAASAMLPAAVGKAAGLTLGKGALLAAVAVGVVGGVSWLGHRLLPPASVPRATLVSAQPGDNTRPASTEPASPAPASESRATPPAESPASEPNAPVPGRSERTVVSAATRPVARAETATSAAASQASPDASGAEREARAADDISEQIRMLDAAKRALRKQDPSRALRELSAYQRRFPGGGLAQEATVLRIQAVAQAGDRETAARMAQRFAARHPQSPHIERLTHLLGHAKPPNPPAP